MTIQPIKETNHVKEQEITPTLYGEIVQTLQTQQRFLNNRPYEPRALICKTNIDQLKRYFDIKLRTPTAVTLPPKAVKKFWLTASQYGLLGTFRHLEENKIFCEITLKDSVKKRFHMLAKAIRLLFSDTDRPQLQALFNDRTRLSAHALTQALLSKYEKTSLKSALENPKIRYRMTESTYDTMAILRVMPQSIFNRFMKEAHIQNCRLTAHSAGTTIRRTLGNTSNHR